MLCEMQANRNNFHYLRVQFSYFRENRERFNIRATGDKFDLPISGKRQNWLVDERIDHVTFVKFQQKKLS